jgi:hypothetical protein
MKALACLPALLAAGCIGLEPLESDSEVVPDTDDTSSDTHDYGDLQVSPASVDFGTVTIGTSGEATVVISYEGEGDTIVSDASVEGGSGTMVISNMTSLPSAITADNDAVFELLFSPSSEREYYGELHITTDHHAAGEITVTLDGDGLDDGGGDDGPDISVSPASIDFGTIDTGTSDSRTLTVSNIGGEAFFLTDIITDHPSLEYDFGEYMPLEFDPGEAREVSVTWSPTAIGSLNSEVLFESDVEGEESLSIPVTGESDDICDICAPMISVDTGGAPYEMTFFCISLLGMPDTQAVNITNSGDQTLTIRDIYVNNDALATAGTFSTNWNGSSVTLDPWQQREIQVSFIATSTALEVPYEAFDMNILHIISDAANEPDYAIGLSATGL